MNDGVQGLPLIRRSDGQGSSSLDDRFCPPDQWCFGLAHPYIQRLIFLANSVEDSPIPKGSANSPLCENRSDD